MIPFSAYSPISFLSLVASLLNPLSQAPQSAKTFEPASTRTIASANIEPTHTAVRDFVQSVSLRPSHGNVDPADKPILPDLNPPTQSHNEIGTDFDSLTEQEDRLVSLINRERTSEGLNELTVDPLLTSVARSHSEDMSARGYFDHRAPSPGPVTPMDRYLAASEERPSFAMVGENIYYRSNTDSISSYADEAHEAFMQSPGHRANVLQPQYTHVGVGIYRNPSTGEFWVTEMFLRDTQ